MKVVNVGFRLCFGECQNQNFVLRTNMELEKDTVKGKIGGSH